MIKNNRFKIIIVIGLVAIIGVILTQLLVLKRAYQFEKQEFTEKIYIGLTEVVANIHKDNHSEVPHTNLITKVSEEYYIVNVNQTFDATSLEYYLSKEFQKVKLTTDFEFAVYDCSSDKMVYGKYISTEDKSIEKCEDCFEKNKDLVYYFAIRFPDLKSDYLSSLKTWASYTVVLFLVLIIYVYSIVLLLKQKKFSELQKDFINNMTHEFKTPLSSILIASNYAQQQEEIKNNPKLKRYVDIIIAQSEKLNHHVERILYVAKTDSKQFIIKKESLVLTEILESVKENILLKYPEASINIKVPDAYKIVADSFHFYNILYNIFENSIKYNQNLPNIQVQATQTNKTIELQISDNGQGIEPEKLPYIFDKFFRAHNEKENTSEGFGLGLFYVKKIVQLHHWKIKIINNPTQGITTILKILD